MNYELMQKYFFVKTVVMDEGFYKEIDWQSQISFDELDESTFLKEFAWVVLSSGMKNTIIEMKFESISNCFYNWKSSKLIVENSNKCFKNAIKMFANKLKINAILDATDKINEIGFTNIKKLIEKNPIEYLQKFKFIGPITVYHLAKNIGLQFAKPDRHLKKIANMHNYSDVQVFCEEISKHTGDSVPVVDIIFWRFATIEPDYKTILSCLKVNQKSSYGSISAR